MFEVSLLVVFYYYYWGFFSLYNEDAHPKLYELGFDLHVILSLKQENII